MKILSPSIQQYLQQNSSPENPVLKQLDRTTHLNFLLPQMISGHEQGILLEILSRMLQPKCILEIGTFTGYAAICMAKGLIEGGVLHTIDKNQELAETNQQYFKKAGLTNKIQCYYGNAMEIIPTLNQKFDLIFIDADKKNYSNYYKLVIDKLTIGGTIIADNVLWNGEVVTDSSKAIPTEMRNFNAMVTADARVINTIIPIRDGLMIAQKITA